MNQVSSSTSEKRTVPHSPRESNSLSYFQYLGNKTLIVIGKRTGKRYRFDRPGVVVAVDPRDRRSIETLSILKVVEINKQAVSS